jgi:predicted dienelactone hydrolase
MIARALLPVLCLTLTAADRVTHIDIAGRDVAIWKPAGASPKSGFPLVVFSHGFSGCNTQSKFLMEAFAEAGYLVLAPNHEDARCGSAHGGNLTGGFGPKESFIDPSKWSDETYRSRAADVGEVINAALKSKKFEGVAVDPRRIGLAGHSLGGYTALGLAGAWPSWRDPRIKAVLALSAYCTPYMMSGELEKINVPVMYQGGTLDFGVTPFIRRGGGAYDLTSTPKYYVEFRGAGHGAWTDWIKKFHGVIDDYSIAFFDRYLKNDAAKLDRLAADPRPELVSKLTSRIGHE